MAAIIAAPGAAVRSQAGRKQRPAFLRIRESFSEPSIMPFVCKVFAAFPRRSAIGNDFPGRRKRGRDRRQRQADEPDYKRTEDVIYGRKFGTALTMDVFQPREANGVAMIFCVSGGWFSAHERSIRLSLPSY